MLILLLWSDNKVLVKKGSATSFRIIVHNDRKRKEGKEDREGEGGNFYLSFFSLFLYLLLKSFLLLIHFFGLLQLPLPLFHLLCFPSSHFSQCIMSYLLKAAEEKNE